MKGAIKECSRKIDLLDYSYFLILNIFLEPYGRCLVTCVVLKGGIKYHSRKIDLLD